MPLADALGISQHDVLPGATGTSEVGRPWHWTWKSCDVKDSPVMTVGDASSRVHTVRVLLPPGRHPRFRALVTPTHTRHVCVLFFTWSHGLLPDWMQYEDADI